MIKNKLLRTGGIYRIIYTTWKTQERPISFVLYSGPSKIHALNINAKNMSILDIRKFVTFVKRMKNIKGVEKYTGRVLYSILRKYFPDIIRKTYRTYSTSNVLGFSLVSTGIIPPQFYTDYERSYYNKFIYNQAQFDTLLKVFNFESKTKYTPPPKPTLYNPQQEIKVKLESERKPIIKDQKRELIVPSNQGKENDFFSIYDED
jgi:hypothetical protein